MSHYVMLSRNLCNAVLQYDLRDLYRCSRALGPADKFRRGAQRLKSGNSSLGRVGLRRNGF